MGMLEQDIDAIVSSTQIDWMEFYGKKIMITGSTGLMGRLMVESLSAFNHRNKANIQLILPVRNGEKAQRLFRGTQEGTAIIKEMTLTEIAGFQERADYVIHCAAPTRSSFFVTYPVETINSILGGTCSVLEYVRNVHCESMVNLSSMEVFGYSQLPVLKEEDLGTISLNSVRSSYSQAKRMTELMCYAYAMEYQVPVKVARLAQVFGPGVDANDSRVFMQFCHSVLSGEDIVLNTTGETVINYCYTTDAVLGIYKLLLAGQNGETYTVVNDDPVLNIRQMAEWLVNTYGKAGQAVRFTTGLESQYAPSSQSKLSNQKMRNLGWSAQYSVKDGYERLLSYMGETYAKK